MIRMIIMLLLLAVVFLSGTHYGMSQSSGEKEVDLISGSNDMETMIPSHHISENSETPVTPTPIVNQDVMMDDEVHLTQKTASFLETSVQGFYEIVVGVMYQIAETFF
ncbi:hypothetical protein [Oceanobacillus salinisoli]|uniref:hypothetical protein n=1 Tax=Oceanobacillus salinisoli TaxID=2678611 RepID=UPI0012E3117F|nr:hypothetical protein [Oceanobacillus salinisoli]